MDRKFIVGMVAAVLAVGALGYTWMPRTAPESGTGSAPSADPGSLTGEQIARLGIQLERAVAADTVPLGTVPGQVSLPPQARVAVSAPFRGVALRVLVLEGEQVVRGQPLAIVRAAEPVQFGAEMKRAQADLGFERARAERLALLAREGVVAGARADEARAALARTEATIAENRRLLALAGASGDGTATLRAPISGRVAKVSVETGGSVGGDMAPLVIENTDSLTLDLQLPERMAGQVAPGMPVTIQLTGAGLRATGRILSVSGSLDPATRSLAAKASLASGSGLVPGQAVSVSIATGHDPRRSGVSILAAAVTRIEGSDFVFVSESKRFVRRKVTVVASGEDRAVVSAGLKPGESVAVSGVAELKSILGGE